MIARRSFIALLGGVAATWPLAARAQQSAMPVVGFLSSTSPDGYAKEVAAFRAGLANTGFVEGRNVAIEFRWAQDRYDRLPVLIAELIQRRVAVIVATGAVRSPLAAKAATTTIPIVFHVGSDPVEFGLVERLSRPGGNITGSTSLGRELLAKRVQVLRELVPGAREIGLLVNPDNPNTESSVKELHALARADGWVLHVAIVRAPSDLDMAFAAFVQEGVRAWLHATDAIFNNQRREIVALAARHALPGIYAIREAADAGGLMSYGTTRTETYGQVGIYTGRILKGEKPADLPVQKATKVELVINLKTAKMLGIEMPTGLLVRADEVIE